MEEDYQPETIIVPLTLTRVAVEDIVASKVKHYTYKFEHPDAPGSAYIVEAMVPYDEANEDTIARLFQKALEYDLTDLADVRRERIFKGEESK